MWCLTAEEEYSDLLNWGQPRDPAMPGQTDSNFQCRAGCQTAPSAQQSQWSGWLCRRIGAMEIHHRSPDELWADGNASFQEFSKNGEVGNRAIWPHIRRVKFSLLTGRFGLFWRHLVHDQKIGNFVEIYWREKWLEYNKFWLRKLKWF